MRTFVTLFLTAIAFGSCSGPWQSGRAETTKKSGTRKTTYYRPHRRGSTKGPAAPTHKDNNYDQNGWNH